MYKTLGSYWLLTFTSLLTAAALVDRPITAQQISRTASPTPADTQNAGGFETAVIKENRSGETGVRVQFQPGGRFVGVNVTLQSLIRNVYQVQPFQIIGGPSWITSERFDVTAKAADSAVPAQMMGMVQTLLTDRFKLVIRRETRELPTYNLVLARPDGRLGPQLKASAADCSGGLRGAPPPVPLVPSSRPTCGVRLSGATLTAGGTTLAQLASNLSNAFGRTVVDRTGLTGGYDMDLTFTPDATMRPPANAPAVPADGPSLETALREQLGLKLEASKGLVEVLVIERAERPTTEN